MLGRCLHSANETLLLPDRLPASLVEVTMYLLRLAAGAVNKFPQQRAGGSLKLLEVDLGDTHDRKWWKDTVASALSLGIECKFPRWKVNVV